MTVRSSNLLEGFARFGYGARGVVYCLVGSLALLAAAGFWGQTGGSRSALQSLTGEPFGKLILGVIAFGLLGFAAWRIVEGITDADRLGGSGKALARRAGHVSSGFVYVGLAISAIGLALGRSASQSEDQSARDWTAWLLSQPFGQWLVGLAGVAVVGTGIVFALRGWRGEVTERMALNADTRRWAVPLGRLGFAARGLVFVLIGGFLALAALNSNSSEVKGLGGALKTLQTQPYGWVLLGLTAAGLLGFGIFGLVQARYRRIDAPDAKDIPAAAARSANGMLP